MTSATYPGEPKPITRGEGKANRRDIGGVIHMYCRKCGTWKPADDEHFYKLNYGMFGSPCKACSIDALVTGYCPAPGCGKALYKSNKSGFCLKHTPRATVACIDCGKPIRKGGTGRCMQCYHKAIVTAPKPHCTACGKEISRQSTTGMCIDCYNAARKVQYAEEARQAGEFYSGLGDLCEPVGVAPAGNDWIFFKDGSWH